MIESLHHIGRAKHWHGEVIACASLFHRNEFRCHHIVRAYGTGMAGQLPVSLFFTGMNSGATKSVVPTVLIWLGNYL